MRFLYHARPPDMRGETLYPLNRLRSIDRALYEREQAKYEGREAVLEFRIPLIDVLWNDTLHLSTIHPYHLAAAWRAVGLWTPTLERPFFQIPVERVGRYQSVCLQASRSGSTTRRTRTCRWHRRSRSSDCSISPTIGSRGRPPVSYYEYLRRQRQRGHRPLLFPKVPHVLVSGPVDVAGLALVRSESVSEPSGD